MQIDKSIIEACLRQDRASQVLLYKACYASFMHICLRYKKNENEAAALLNEGMMKVLDNLPKYTADKPFEYWAKRVMINLAIDDYRKRRTRLQHFDYKDSKELEILDYRQEDNEAIAQLEAEELWSLINELPSDRRQIFNLVAIDGYTYREASDIIGINENTCKWHVSEARKCLQKALQQNFVYSNYKKNEAV